MQGKQDLRDHLHVLHLVYFDDSDIPGAEALRAQYYTTTSFCASLRAAGGDL